MKNHFKTKLHENGDPVGTWISIGHPALVEINASLGFDFLLVDSEHTTIGLETLASLVRAAEAKETALVIRVPSDDPVRIKRVLDLGTDCIMIPMVESAGEARQIIDAVRYPPDGNRGIASSRATDYGRNFEGYVESANSSIATIAQIETRKALENVEEIAQVEGITALFVGPADLSGSLGVFAEWESEELTDAIQRVVETGRRYDVPVGTLVIEREDIAERVTQGFDFMIVGKDTNILYEGGERAKEEFTRALEEHRTRATTED